MATVRNTISSIDFVASIFSLPGNIFIIVVNVLDFYKTRRLLLSDQLIFGFSVLGLLHGLQEAQEEYKELLQLANDEYDKKATQILKYLNVCSLWVSTLLSIHFCLKIVTIHHWFYIGLQRTFPKLFPWIIITFLLVNFFMSLYSELDTNCERLLNATSTFVIIKDLARCYWFFLVFVTICLVCSFLCSVSTLTILNSLLKHMKRIQENTEGPRSPNMDAHVRAIKTVTTLLAANILISSSMVILGFYDESWVNVFSILISICYTFSSYFLIKGTKKLYIEMAKILNWCRCFRGECQ